MKQIIVMVSMIVLGLVIAGVVLGFQGDVTAMGTETERGLSAIQTQLSSAAAVQ